LFHFDLGAGAGMGIVFHRQARKTLLVVVTANADSHVVVKIAFNN